MSSLISVIVPVYNAENYISRCIESILNQTYTNLEIILIDDGSTDSSVEKCDIFAMMDRRIKVIHKKNGGVSSARNAGLNIATGEYIGFVDSDDYISPNMYELLIKACEKHKSVATVGSYQESENGNISVRHQFVDSVVSTEEFLRNMLCRNDGTAVWSRLFPKEVIGDSRFNEGKLNEEILFWMSIMNRVHKVAYISSINYYYYQRSESLSHQFGKNVYDMIGNAVDIRAYISKMYPELLKEAERFEIFQHMSYLLSCPSNYNRKKDPLYRTVLLYVKKHRIAGLKNPFFTTKEKIMLIGVSCFPKIFSRLIEIKGKRNETTTE